MSTWLCTWLYTNRYTTEQTCIQCQFYAKKMQFTQFIGKCRKPSFQNGKYVYIYIRRFYIQTFEQPSHSTWFNYMNKCHSPTKLFGQHFFFLSFSLNNQFNGWQLIWYSRDEPAEINGKLAYPNVWICRIYTPLRLCVISLCKRSFPLSIENFSRWHTNTQRAITANQN